MMVSPDKKFPVLHADIKWALNRFKEHLEEKLIAAQEKYGYSTEWLRDNWEEECRAELMRHIEKGDPHDVAIYAMFLWYHGWSTNA